MASFKSWSNFFRSASNHRMCSSTWGRNRWLAWLLRFFSEVSISTTCRRRPANSFTSRVKASGKGLGLQFHHFAVVRQHLGVQCIGLGQLAAGTGKVPYPPGVDHRHRYPRHHQFRRQGGFHSASPFHHHHCRLHLLEKLHQCTDSTEVIRRPPGFHPLGRTARSNRFLETSMPTNDEPFPM